MGDIVVLRLGHRPERDARVTTHVGLTSRALGASGMLLTSDDKSVAQSIERVDKSWGGGFWVRIGIGYRSEIKKWKEKGGIVVHLTMYGINLPDCIDTIRNEFKAKSIMVVVGAEKVPGDVYQLADYNVAVGNQPHSEIAALALFLDWLQQGREFEKTFRDGELKILPCEHGKSVERK
ncbi:MAG TPA: tRNA (cytidine(56)-2'-O)-methyltransferase [Methanocella sp.]|uniref:tRNA (cytidine(56)-2'-O)-methyltransferase n=1 Tax=Methanocella sp. TaxID=2052833 RepID=UPI002C8B63B4|nr:tRNA (cytidine(56)-2'-O)-methyltransferase [Methanocella sp.]HTY89784.1 tRNA (cytidine(56)-2'-O)-methyltransferase [Methanocella sp.]